MGKDVTLQRNDYFNDFVALLLFSSVQDDHAPVWATRSAVSSPEVIYVPSQRNLFTENLSNISWLTLNLATAYHCLCMGADCRSHILSNIFVILNNKTSRHNDIKTLWHHDITTSWHLDIKTSCSVTFFAPTHLLSPQCTSGYQYQYKQVRKTPSLFYRGLLHYQYCI